MRRRFRPVEGHPTLFDSDSDERDEPAPAVGRTNSVEHPEQQLDEQSPVWREWAVNAIAVPELVTATAVESGKPRGNCRGETLVDVLAAIHRASGDHRGTTLSVPALAKLAHLSPSQTDRAVRVLESLVLVEVHRRARVPGRQREPHTYAIAWGNVRELVPPSRLAGEPIRWGPLVERDVPSHEGTPTADVPSHEGTPPLVTSPRGAADTSSRNNVCNVHVGDGLRDRSGEGDWLGNVEPADLRNAEWLDATFSRAVAAGWLRGADPDRVFLFAAAAHARRKATVPGAMFRRMIEDGRRGWPTDADTETARGMLLTRERRRRIDRPHVELAAGKVGRSVPHDRKPTALEFERDRTEQRLRLLERFPIGGDDA